MGSCVDLIDLSQNRDRLRAVVSAAMILRLSLKCGQFLD